MKTAVIISTYNAPETLRLCLYGFSVQRDAEFDIVIADDGSDERTAAMLEETEFESLLKQRRMQHVWQEDDGFRLSAIRNRAIRATDADYLIFIDGDCIPRDDFVSSHQQAARPNHFAAGGRVDVPEPIHRNFNRELIVTNEIFEPAYLESRDSSMRRYRRRLARNSRLESLMNLLTWRPSVFAGSNAAAWRTDIYRVNGFDESFPGYGSEDRDIGIRLRNSGVSSRYLKHSLVQIHLGHPRSYFNPEINAKNRAVFKQRRRDGTIRIEKGLEAA